MVVQITGDQKNPNDDEDDEEGDLSLQSNPGESLMDQGSDPLNGK
jgi:hypothetical protein